MRFHPKKLYVGYLFFLIFSFACSKDNDLLKDYVLSEESDTISVVKDSSSSDKSEDTNADNEPYETSVEDGFETRITSFPPIADAYMVHGKGYNESLIRMEENLRKSYLLFDLSRIEELGGYITDVNLLITIRAIEGNGDITVFDSSSSDWSEDNLNTENVPTKNIVLGSISDIYKVGSTQEIILNASDILTDLNSLILEHANGDPFAYASKEHQSGGWPKLVVTYNIPEEAPEIEIEEPKYESTDSGSSSGEEDNTQNQGSSEDGTSDETNNEDSDFQTGGGAGTGYVPPTADVPELVFNWVAREQTGADGTPITSATDHSDSPTTVTPFNVDVKVRNGRPEADFGNSGTARFELGNPAKLLFTDGVTSGTILYVAGTNYRGTINAVVFKGDQQLGPGEFSMIASLDDVYGRTYSGGAAQAAEKGSQTADYEVVALTFEAEGANTRNTFWFEGVEAINNSDYTHGRSTVRAGTEWFIGIEKDSDAGSTFAFPYNGSLLAVLIFRDKILTGQEMIDIKQEILDMPEGGY